MSGVTPEDREKAIVTIWAIEFPAFERSHYSVESKIVEDHVDALIALGWAPGGAPVVDRETFVGALASALGWNWPEAEGVPSSEDVVTGIFDALREDTVFVDRVTVEREQREKDALIVEDVIRNLVNADVAIVAGAVRAGGFAQYREGKR